MRAGRHRERRDDARVQQEHEQERAAEAGYFLSARSYFSYGNLKPWDKVKQASKEKWREWARLMLEATLNGTEEPC